MKINNQESLIKLLEKEFPLKTQEKWDFSGFSFFSPNPKKLKVMILLDVDKKAILRAIKEEVSLIISHHPFCFATSWLEAIKLDDSKQELFNLVEENNISTYSLHTNFDAHQKGTGYFLLKKLCLLDKVIKNYKFASVIKYSSSFESLVKLLKSKLSLNFLISNWSFNIKEIVNKVYFAPGVGDIYEYIKHNKITKYDLLVTSDIKWNEQIVLQNLELNFIIISHQVEEVFIDGINDFLIDKLSNDVKVILDYKNEYIKIF